MFRTPSDKEIALLVEFAEAEGWADLFLSAPAALAGEFGIRAERLGSAIVLVAAGLDYLVFNRVIGLGMKEPATELVLDKIVEVYDEVGVQNFAVQLSPSAEPSALRTWLEERGLGYRDDWNKCYRKGVTAEAVRTDVRVESIDRSRGDVFSRIACAAFGFPDSVAPWLAASVGRSGWRHYLGSDGDEPIAAGALFVKNQVGWIVAGSTLESHRRRGAQGALMVRRIRDAVDLGCRWLVTETRDGNVPSYSAMLRAGFELAYRRPNYSLKKPLT